MTVRTPFRAGSFYEANPAACRREAEALLAAAEPPEFAGAAVGGLAPHAGWAYSGRLAALTFRALDAAAPLETVILLGAVHTHEARGGEVYSQGAWRSPLGDCPVDAPLAAELIDACEHLHPGEAAHAHEHSIEVQIPILQVLRPGVRIVPIAITPMPEAVEIGRAIGRLLAGRGTGAAVVASTDLTHHGGHFPAPGGRGEASEAYSRANDRRLLEIVERMDAEAVLPEVLARENACGGGAVAACVAACRQLGAARGDVLEYTNSYEITHARHARYADDTTVGYASVVFLKEQ